MRILRGWKNLRCSRRISILLRRFFLCFRIRCFMIVCLSPSWKRNKWQKRKSKLKKIISKKITSHFQVKVPLMMKISNIIKKPLLELNILPTITGQSKIFIDSKIWFLLLNNLNIIKFKTPIQRVIILNIYICIF